MRHILRSAAVIVTTVVLGAGAASAQNNPMSYEALIKAKQGAWAEYNMTMPGMGTTQQPQKLTVRYAVVTKNERELTLESDSQTPMGPVHSSMVFAPTPPDALKLVKARIQMGTQAPIDMPPSQLSQGTIKKTDTAGTLIGAEKVKVPAGTFETKHYRRTVTEAGGMTLDVWMSDKAVPTGVVKLTGTGGVEMVLASTGMGAKPKPEAKPAATDTEKAPAEKTPAKK
ncbi:MAG TPA: hypothetical protein VN947_17140 [Polyangia bacterium]|nr:hypothetical protein [Polyangia bacterium]